MYILSVLFKSKYDFAILTVTYYLFIKIHTCICFLFALCLILHFSGATLEILRE